MIRDLVTTLRKSLISFCVHQIYWPEVSSRGEYILFRNRMVLSEYVRVTLAPMKSYLRKLEHAYPAFLVILKGAFWTQSNIYDAHFLWKYYRL